MAAALASSKGIAAYSEKSSAPLNSLQEYHLNIMNTQTN
jgi:hypothetical protein